MTTTFAGEPFLREDTGLPDYDSERLWLVIKAILIMVLFTVVLPLLMAAPREKKEVTETKTVKTNLKGEKRGKKGKLSNGKQEEPEKTDKNGEDERLEAPLVQLNLAVRS